MHTYRKADGGKWQAGYLGRNPGEFTPLGPAFAAEADAAAFASFLNGGRYCPDEIAHIFAVPVDEEADDEPEDHTTPPSKGNFADYPHEGLQSHRQARK